MEARNKHRIASKAVISLKVEYEKLKLNHPDYTDNWSEYWANFDRADTDCFEEMSVGNPYD